MDKEKLRVFDNRLDFKEHCRLHGVKTPKTFAANELAKLTAWAMKHNSFPLVMKTEKNLTGGKHCYLLRAYREFPEFFEQISEEHQGLVLVEELAEGRARVELCCFEGKISHVAQFALEKSVFLRHAWRAFPVNLPAGVLGQMKSAVATFKEYLLETSAPVIFSFVVGREPILISANENPLRPELESMWGEGGGALVGPKTPRGAGLKKFCKLVYRRDFDEQELEEALLRKVCDESLVFYKILDKDLVLVFTSDSLEQLQKVHSFNL